MTHKLSFTFHPAPWNKKSRTLLSISHVILVHVLFLYIIPKISITINLSSTLSLDIVTECNVREIQNYSTPTAHFDFSSVMITSPTDTKGNSGNYRHYDSGANRTSEESTEDANLDNFSIDEIELDGLCTRKPVRERENPFAAILKVSKYLHYKLLRRNSKIIMG